MLVQEIKEVPLDSIFLIIWSVDEIHSIGLNERVGPCYIRSIFFIVVVEAKTLGFDIRPGSK